MSSFHQLFQTDSLAELLEYIYYRCGVDFRLYRKDTVERRLVRRIFSVGCKDYSDYLSYLRTRPEEHDQIVANLTVKVSRFFRDSLVFEVLKDQIIPGLISEKIKLGDRHLHFWSAGCAFGQEAYSLAILMVDLLSKYPDFKAQVIASDIDRHALIKARRAEYSEEDVFEVKKGYLNKYFETRGSVYKVKAEVRNIVKFSYYDLIKNNPGGPVEGVLSTYDLILCRNVTMYFNRQLQEDMLRRLWNMLGKPGYLVLGRPESLPASLASRAEEVCRGTRIFRKLF